LESSFKHAATQYGAIWFTHDNESTIISNLTVNTSNSTASTGGVTYDSAIDVICPQVVSSQGLNYTTEQDCARFKGVGYLIQYNFTGIHSAPLFQALADQALVRYATNKNDFTISATIAPLPITKREAGQGNAVDFFTAWFLVRFFGHSTFLLSLNLACMS
jgi:hypothetical protein